MSFSLEFEEVPLVFCGVPISHVAGRADFTSSGDVDQLAIENPFEPKGRRLVLTGKSADDVKNTLFRIISASVKETCVNRIQNCLVDTRRGNVLDYYDWKRKSAAEMSS